MDILNSISLQSLYKSFDNSLDPIVITNSDLENGVKMVYVNNAFCQTTEYKRSELIGKSPKILQGKKSNFKVLQELKEELKKANTYCGQTVNYKKSGQSYLVKWSISPLKDNDENIIAFISYQKVLQNSIKFDHEKLLSSVVDISKNLVLVSDLNGKIVYVNNAFCNKLGYDKDELLSEHTRVLKSGEQNSSFYFKMWKSILTKGSFSDVFISRKKDGSLFYDKKDINTIKDKNGDPIYYVSISHDITNQVQKEKKLQKEVFVDTLTKQYNRKKYDKVISQKIEKFNQDKELFSLILIDIDHFKSINDNYGHDMGDYILKEFASLIKENIRSTDMLFRWGGEEFALLVDQDKEQALKTATKLKETIKKHNFQSIKITASFGISQIEDNIISSRLFNNADKVLYEAKKSGRDCVKVF